MPRYENGFLGSLICECGNQPEREGFFPCNIHGLQIEPTEKDGWTDLYVCDRCGAIIKCNPREGVDPLVVGQRAMVVDFWDELLREEAEPSEPEGKLDLEVHQCVREESWEEYDAQGIYLCRVCDLCCDAKLSRYRPEILSGYTQADIDEPIEEDC